MGSPLAEVTISNTRNDHTTILQQSDSSVSEHWTLLDSQSTVDFFCNAKFLKNVHHVKTALRIYSTGGTSYIDIIGFLEGYGWVWYYPEGIANILSLSRVKKKFRVTFDSHGDNEFHVHIGQNRVRRYKESKNGLYYSDIREYNDATVLVNTVEYNKSKYSSRDYLRALDDRKLQKNLGGPSYKHFKQICSVRNPL